MSVNNPSKRGIVPTPAYNIKLPDKIRANEKMMAVMVLILPEGIGRFLVRGIILSISFSCTWLSAAEPDASKNIPITANINWSVKMELKRR